MSDVSGEDGGKPGRRQPRAPRVTQHKGATTPGQRRSDPAARDRADLHVAAGNVTEPQFGPTPDRAERPPSSPFYTRRLCGKYVGDNDATCPQLTCIRDFGHDGLCDNSNSDPKDIQ